MIRIDIFSEDWAHVFIGQQQVFVGHVDEAYKYLVDLFGVETRHVGAIEYQSWRRRLAVERSDIESQAFHDAVALLS